MVVPYEAPYYIECYNVSNTADEKGLVIRVACTAICFLVYMPDTGAVHLFSSMTNALIEAMTW